jgi:hypothetical protein
MSKTSIQKVIQKHLKKHFDVPVDMSNYKFLKVLKGEYDFDDTKSTLYYNKTDQTMLSLDIEEDNCDADEGSISISYEVYDKRHMGDFFFYQTTTDRGKNIFLLDEDEVYEKTKELLVQILKDSGLHFTTKLIERCDIEKYNLDGSYSWIIKFNSKADEAFFMMQYAKQIKKASKCDYDEEDI